MKLAISNIAWTAKQDETIYGVMKKHDFTGLEIAPTRIFPVTPYKHLRDATEWAESINKRYGFVIPSMHRFCGDYRLPKFSIWLPSESNYSQRKDIERSHKFFSRDC